MVSEDEPSDVERWEAAAQAYSGLGHPIRVAIVETLVTKEDRPLTEVADQFDVSRSAVQKHVNKLEEAELVYRPEGEARHYALTPLGVYLAGRLTQKSRVFAAALARVSDAEETARSELESVPLGETAMEKAVTTRKWELVEDELEEVLDMELPEVPDLEDVDGVD